MKLKPFLFLLAAILAAGAAPAQVTVTKRGVTPPHNIRNYDANTNAAKLGQMLGVRRYSSTVGDTLVGFVPVYYLGDSLLKVGTYTVAHSGNLGTLGIGTVTSVGLSMPSGFSVGSSPITSLGTIAVTTSLNGPLRGNGSGFTTGNLALGSEVSGVLPAANGGTGLSALGTAGQLIRVNTGATALEYFTPAYLTANQTITLSGDVSGSGTTGITTTIGTGAVTSAKILDGTIAAGDLSALGATTTGQVLTWNGSAWAAAAASGGISGSGTSGYLPKWSGTSSQTNSNLQEVTFAGGFYYKLDASGTTNSFGLVPSSIDYYFGQNVVSAAGDALNTSVAGISASAINTSYSAGISFYTSNGALTVGTNIKTSTYLRLAIQQDGDVGIATPNPLERLHVTGNVRYSGILFGGDGSASAPSVSYVNDTNTGLYRPSADVLAVTVGGVEEVRFDLNGLQVGTAGVNLGALRLAGNTSGTVTVRPSAAAGTWTMTLPTSTGTSGQYLTTDGTGATSWATISAVTGTGTSGRVAYWSGTGSITSAASFLFDGTNLTTTNPTYISATASNTSPSIAFSGDVDNGWYRPSADVQRWATAGTDRLELSSNGLGLGGLPLSGFTTRGSGNTAFTAGNSAVTWVNTVSNLSMTMTLSNSTQLRIADNSSNILAQWTNGGAFAGNVVDNTTSAYSLSILAGATFLSFNSTNAAEVLTVGSNAAGSTVVTAAPFLTAQYTATAASALTPADGWIIYVTSTNATFTSIGYWGREAGVWKKF